MKSHKTWEKIKPYFLILPAMVGIVVFTVYPIIKIVYWSLHKVNQLNMSKTTYVGLNNFKKIFNSRGFIKAIRNTGIYSLWTIVIVMFIALLVAVWLGKKKDRLSSITQTTIFTPHIISMVSIALIFSQMMNPTYGIFNSILEKLNLPKSQWLQQSSTALGSLIFIACWKGIGYYSLILIGALQSISPSIYEACSLDDAKPATVLRKITLPLISPQIFFNLIVMTIDSFKVFDLIRVATDGGPNNATTSLVYYIYLSVFFDYNIGQAAAAGTILLIIVGVLTFFYFFALSKKVYYQ